MWHSMGVSQPRRDPHNAMPSPCAAGPVLKVGATSIGVFPTPQTRAGPGRTRGPLCRWAATVTAKPCRGSPGSPSRECPDSAKPQYNRQCASPALSVIPADNRASACLLTPIINQSGARIAPTSSRGKRGATKSSAGRSHPTEKGARVRFRMSDVFLPSAEGLSDAPSADAEMEGVIVDFSDSGPRRDAFAVVELDDGKTMVVPIEKVVPVAALENGRR